MTKRFPNKRGAPGSSDEPQYHRVMQALVGQYTAPAASSKETAWEVLVFTLLSARTRDEQTELVFRDLLLNYPGPLELAEARVSDVARILQRIGLYKTKARNVVALAQRIQDEYAGQVPRTLEQLVDLPGVGVKTASCVLVYAFHQPAIPVDTHVHRIVNRLGWVKETTPEKTGTALMVTVPKKWWMDMNRVMVQFGRQMCIPGKPKCFQCPVSQWCAYPKKTKALDKF